MLSVALSNARSNSLLTLFSLSEQTFMQSHPKACFLFYLCHPFEYVFKFLCVWPLKMSNTKNLPLPFICYISVKLQQRIAQMAQSEKNLAAASGASRPDGEQCRYGLSHKKKKKNNVE